MTRHPLLRTRPGPVKLRGLRRSVIRLHQAHQDSDDPYKFPTYRDPGKRRRAREKRRAS